MKKLKFGPTPRNGRPLRRFETCPDNFVFFGQSQALWHFSYIHPWFFGAYRTAARVRCMFHGHEYSRLIESDKHVGNPKRRTNCLYCGSEKVVTRENDPGLLSRKHKSGGLVRDH